MSDDARAGTTPEAPPEDQAPTADETRPEEQSAPPENAPDATAAAGPGAVGQDADAPGHEADNSTDDGPSGSADELAADTSEKSEPVAEPEVPAEPVAEAEVPAEPVSSDAARPATPGPPVRAPRPGPPHPRPPRPAAPPSSTAPASTASTRANTPAAGTPAGGTPTDHTPTDNTPAAGPLPAESADPTATGGAPAATFGRVGEDGTVYVQTSAGERSVGQVPDATPHEALDFFVKRYDALQLEVSLLERRVRSGALSPDDAGSSVKTVRSAVAEAHAVGDLDGLLARLDALSPMIAQQRARRRAERAKQSEATRSAKERFVAEAERLALSNDWRGGVNRFRSLLDEWKTLPRLDRATDDALWHRFSGARTQYTRRRKSQFAQQAEERDSARVIKEKMIADAEKLVGSTEWGPTTGEFRDLMTNWKAAGPAPRDVDEELWRRFRGIQDTFFAAKQAAMSEQDNEFRENQQAKEALLVEGEKLLPVRDLQTARAGYRDLIERWSAIGKVPRDAMRPLETRLQAIESAVRGAEDDRWRRTNPEARARAEETAAKLQTQIATYEARATKAAARGDAKAEQEAKDGAATYREWLAQAERAVDDFSGS